MSGWPPPPHAYQPRPPAKKGPSGCVVAASVLGAIVVVAALVVGVFVVRTWRSFSSDEKEGLRAVWREGERAGSARGTNELRDIGCTPDVIDVATMPELTKLYQSKVDAGALDVGLVIECTANVLMQTPTCDRVAATYVGAVKRAAGPFRVTVIEVKGAENHVACTTKHDATGARLP